MFLRAAHKEGDRDGQERERLRVGENVMLNRFDTVIDNLANT